MKVAKNMDSVFAGSTKDELEFEVMFDEDDCLIDLVAGVNESGEYVTGANPEDTYEYQLDENGDPLTDEDADDLRDGSEKYDSDYVEGEKQEVIGAAQEDFDWLMVEMLEADDPLTDEDADDLRDGSEKYAGDPVEGSKKDADEDFESPEGMKSEIPGSGNSAEGKAYDVTKDIEDAIGESEFDIELEMLMMEEDDPITDKCDTGRREGDVKDDSNNVEGEKQEVIGAALEGDEGEVCPDCGKPIADCTCESCKEEFDSYFGFMAEEFDPSDETDSNFESELKGAKDDPLTDEDADDLRDGSEKYDSDYVEGEKQEVIGAAQEDFDWLMVEAHGDLDDKVCNSDGMNDVTIPDDIQVNGSSNCIPSDAETQSSDGVEPASEDVVYTGWRNVTESDKVPLSSDDTDIEAIDHGDFESDVELDLDVDYDDDELIDLAISGGSLE